MCQLDWDTGCSDIWLNIIMGVSMRKFLDEIHISIGRLSKANGLPNEGGLHTILDRPQEKKS